MFRSNTFTVNAKNKQVAVTFLKKYNDNFRFFSKKRGGKEGRARR